MVSIFSFGESVEAAKPLEIHHGKVLCFNPHTRFGVDGNVEHFNDDCVRAASLVRHTLLAPKTFRLPVW